MSTPLDEWAKEERRRNEGGRPAPTGYEKIANEIEENFRKCRENGGHTWVKTNTRDGVILKCSVCAKKKEAE